MKPSSLFYLTLTTVLLAVLAHLRSDWLIDPPQRPDSAPAPMRVAEPTPPTRIWTEDRPLPRLWWSLWRR